MIKSIFKYLATPGFFHAEPKDVNPAENIIKIVQANADARKQLKAEHETSKKGMKFSEVNREKARQLFENEIDSLGISEEKIVARFHQHIVYGGLFALMGILSFSLPIMGLFMAFNIHIPILSYFLPTYTYPVLITIFPMSLLLITISAWHFYLAKMIKLRQRFPFKQYISSLKLLPTASEVIR